MIFDFYDYSIISLKKINEYTFYSENLGESDIDKLFGTLMDIKLDQMEYEFFGDENNLYININLRYSNYEDVNKENYPFSREILLTIDAFVKEKKINMEISESVSNPFTDSIGDNNGLLMVLNTLDVDTDFLKNMSNGDINFEIISEKVFRQESGFSDSIKEVIVYVSDYPELIFNGALYDITKWTFSKLTSNLKDVDIRVGESSKINFKKLRKDVSAMVNLKPKELTLKTMTQDGSEYIYEFKATNLEIVVICTGKGSIKEVDTKSLNID